jgi:hypothetical protein
VKPLPPLSGLTLDASHVWVHGHGLRERRHQPLWDTLVAATKETDMDRYLQVIIDTLLDRVTKEVLARQAVEAETKRLREQLSTAEMELARLTQPATPRRRRSRVR